MEMDSYFCYHFETRVVDELVDYQIPDDYEEVIDDPRGSQGRFRYFHCLIERQHQPADTIKQQAALLEQKLSHQSSSNTPPESEVPGWMRVSFKSRFVNFIESLLRAPLYMNQNKFLIVAKLGTSTVRYVYIDADFDDGDNDNDNDDDDDDDDNDNDNDNDDYDDGDSEEDWEEIGLFPASKSSIEALEKVSGLDCGECAICLEKMGEEEVAKRIPCGHVFHGSCIDQWLEKSHLCPLCRYALLF